MSKKPDDAARIAGLASILQSTNRPKDTPSPAPPPTPAPVVESVPAKPAKAKPVGKYRDPNFHCFGLYLRKETHKKVKRRLEDSESGKDVSELVQDLLQQWLTSNS